MNLAKSARRLRAESSHNNPTEIKLTYYFYDPDANNFAGVALSKQDDDRILKIFYSDEPLAPTWKTIQLRGIKENPEAEGDFPSLSNYRIFPLVTQRAWNALSPLIGDQCEPLPALHPPGPCYSLSTS